MFVLHETTKAVENNSSVVMDVFLGVALILSIFAVAIILSRK